MKSLSIKKGLLSLSLCLITALSLVSCASQESNRSPAEERQDSITKDGSTAPYEFHGRRFERNNQY